MAMNILHHYGITSKHKKIFKDYTLKDAIRILGIYTNKQYTAIKNLLEIALNIRKENDYSESDKISTAISNKKLYSIPFQSHSSIKEPSNIYSLEKSVRKIIPDEELKIQLQQQKYRGHAGEQLVLAHYIDKIQEANIKDYKKEQLIHEVIDVSHLHGYGYDIVALDLNTLSEKKPEKIYIEVKTTSSKELSTPFYLSKNEVMTGIRLREKYKIGRIIDFNSRYPKYFEITPFKNAESTLDFLSNLEKNLDFEPTEFIITGWHN